jgi:DNA-binding transcriptional regulator YiaG
MSEYSKAIGIRIPIEVWENLKKHGLARYPNSRNKEGFDLTQSIVSLLKQSLEMSDDVSTAVIRSNELDEIQSQIDDLRSRVETIEGQTKTTSQKANQWVSSRDDGGLSRNEFAAFLGVNPTTIGRWENGKLKPSKANADLFDRYQVKESIWYRLD